MSDTLLAGIALGLYLTTLILAFGVRAWVQFRRTGATGFVGFSEPAGSLGWYGGLAFAAALVTCTLALAAGAFGWFGPLGTAAHALTSWGGYPILAGVGLLLVVVAIAVVLRAQSDMGTSWRVGVDHHESNTLVTTGLFARVRNPVFTGMVMALVGFTLIVPTPLTALALVVLILGVQIQVRAVEEPYLLANHPAAYPAYAARTGRFLPGLGRLPAGSGDTAPERRCSR
ncbi:methyltransferase family protein [Ornithinimicrobium panacihumi]|uniref:methyltransferase family protein n=1 Tax=Ornithinimicrobium panacihumi TaxID=2008449 RepID=UPI003F889E1A